jgi:hypothetical protein
MGVAPNLTADEQALIDELGVDNAGGTESSPEIVE